MISNAEAETLIENQSMELRTCGIDRFPGKMMEIDRTEIEIQSKVYDIKLRAWFDDDSKQPMFIISYFNYYIIMDYYHEASGVWEYLLKKFSCKKLKL